MFLNISINYRNKYKPKKQVNYMKRNDITPYINYNREILIYSGLNIKNLKGQIVQCKTLKNYINSPDVLKRQIYTAIQTLSNLIEKFQRKTPPPLQKGLDKDYTLPQILRIERKLLLEIYSKMDKKASIIPKNLRELGDWLQIEEVYIRNM